MNVVLVPGLFGFDQLGGVDYFNGVAGHLEQTFPGLCVKAAKTDPLGTVATRADTLAQQIGQLFGAENVHLVAHSMGGLDARFLASHNPAVGAQIGFLDELRNNLNAVNDDGRQFGPYLHSREIATRDKRRSQT